MPTDWRRLLDEIGVPWVDRGRNHRAGNICIKCPYCGDADPSEHLLISEYIDAYFCHRSRLHRGRDLVYLLGAIMPRSHYTERIRLLNRHNVTAIAAYTPAKSVPTDIEVQWSRFIPATQNRKCIDYLYSRGFTDPDQLCRRYDLRYAVAGRWAQRLLIPIHNADGSIQTWTGRALHDGLSRRYDGPPGTSRSAVYIPRPMRAIGLIVEGPLDALKIAAPTEHMPISPIAMLGLGYTNERLERIYQDVMTCSTLYIALDRTVDTFDAVPLAFFPPGVRIAEAAIPAGFNDPGAMPEGEIVRWVSRLV